MSCRNPCCTYHFFSSHLLYMSFFYKSSNFGSITSSRVFVVLLYFVPKGTHGSTLNAWVYLVQSVGVLFVLVRIVIACALTFNIMLLLLFCQFRTHKVIYRRYAGLFFSMCVDITDNELAYLECIHLFVEILDHFFSNVCELDLVFNFHKVWVIIWYSEMLSLFKS